MQKTEIKPKNPKENNLLKIKKAKIKKQNQKKTKQTEKAQE